MESRASVQVEQSVSAYRPGRTSALWVAARSKRAHSARQEPARGYQAQAAPRCPESAQAQATVGAAG